MKSACFAVGVGLLLYWMLRRRCRMWMFLALLVCMANALMLSADWRIFSHQGMMHNCIVYEIYEHGVPPENPLLAGEPLHYPYGHHFLIAELMRILPVAPPWAFMATNILSVILIAVVLDRIAYLISPDREFRVFAVLLALAGSSPFTRGPGRRTVQLLWAGDLDTRHIPLVKFMEANSNSLGLLLFTIVLLGLLRVVMRDRRHKLAYGYIAGGSVGAGLLYPFAWLVSGTCCAAASLYLLLHRKVGYRRSAGALFAILVVCSAAILPYLLSISVGGSDASTLRVLPSAGHLARNGVILAMVLALPSTLFWMKRDVLISYFRQKPRILGSMLLAAGLAQLMFLFVFIPLHCEYKFLALSLLPLAFPVAVVVREIYRTHRIAGLVVLWAILLPVGSFSIDKAFYHEGVSDPAVTRGRFLRHNDPGEDDLYIWIERQTSKDAVFVDTHLTIPAFARRRLLVGVDDRRESGELDTKFDGWGMPAAIFLEQMNGADPRLLARRRSIASTLLSVESGPVDQAVLVDLGHETKGRPVYIVARSELIRARLAGLRELKVAYRGSAATVFRYALADEGNGRDLQDDKT